MRAKTKIQTFEKWFSAPDNKFSPSSFHHFHVSHQKTQLIKNRKIMFLGTMFWLSIMWEIVI